MLSSALPERHVDPSGPSTAAAGETHESTRSILPACATASAEVIDQPAAGRTRWRVGAIYRAHRHQRLQVAWQFDSNGAEFAAGDVVFNHEAWHVSEAETGTQKRAAHPCRRAAMRSSRTHRSSGLWTKSIDRSVRAARAAAIRTEERRPCMRPTDMSGPRS